ncbi:glycosyltransferase [Pseudooceanicola onchidii]|uniref:glycosyltransferase n=1 Tax=Pseudooceanicola onchidii TaxID=2562279 RepID=UPI0010AAB2E3|nr:glycosyltransferase [Pseudooceanicola onchidii]
MSDSRLATADTLATTPGNLRQDIVVSVCFSDLPATPEAFEALCALSTQLDALYRFREIILVVDEQVRDRYLPLLERVSDLRLFTAQPGSGYYDRRVIAAEEAIGDIVLIGCADEMGYVDMPTLLRQAEQTNSIVVTTRIMRRRLQTGLATPIILLGRLARFKVNPNDIQSIAMPRTLLNQLVSHSVPELALRFPPRDPRFPMSFRTVDKILPSRNGLGTFPRRIQLLQKLLIYLAPTLLMIVSISSSLLAVIGICYAAYVAGAWLVVDTLAPGWLTTSVMLSLSAAFMGLSMLGLSLGLQQLLNQRHEGYVERVGDEINRVDLFRKVASDLNVELESEALPAPRQAP